MLIRNFPWVSLSTAKDSDTSVDLQFRNELILDEREAEQERTAKKAVDAARKKDILEAEVALEDAARQHRERLEQEQVIAASPTGEPHDALPVNTSETEELLTDVEFVANYYQKVITVDIYCFSSLSILFLFRKLSYQILRFLN